MSENVRAPRPLQLDALLRELETPGATLDAVLERRRAAHRPHGADELLRRAAIPRRFDRALYEEALVDPASGPALPFDDFIALPEVQPLPRHSGYVLAADTRARLVSEWRGRAEEWARWNLRLADYIAGRDPADAAGRLYHLVLGKSPDAIAFFEREFEQADAVFDLARCYALLSVLDEVQGELGAELAEVRLRRQQHYRARALFANDYYRTSTYQERPGPLDAFNRVRTGEDKWIFHLYATGGMGKTMFVRWLIARHLVPARVACARVDFDEINCASVARYPWLLLLPMCRQLNEQLPTTYFTELLQKLRAYEPLLQPPTKRTTPATVSSHVATNTAPNPMLEPGDLYARMFASVLNQAGGQVVVVLDTVEGVTLADQFRPVFELLAAIHGQAPQLRVLVAGRYDVAARLDKTAATADAESSAEAALALATKFRAAASIMHLDPFTREEAENYLHSRGLRDLDVIEAIVTKVYQPGDDGGRQGCNPFTLALFVELALGRDSITADDVRAFPSPHYVYLLERVVKRIPEQPLRWVVRYGALPRRLTPDFIKGVLLGPLHQALKGELHIDIPREQVRGGQTIREQDVWVPDPSSTPTAEDLWRDLCRYEGPRGWIWRTGTDDVVQFHGEVVDPMRDLLFSQALFEPLQRVSVAYFMRLAEEQPARWADWTCEAIFHRFQMEGDAAATFWAAQLRSPQAMASPAVRRQIAREVLRREYAEEERQPRMRGEPPVELISSQTLARAHAETAAAIVAQTGYAAVASPDWAELTRHVRLAVELGGAQVLEPHVQASIAAAERAEARDFAAAARLLNAALQNVTATDGRFSLEIQLADMLAMQRDPGASTHYREALRLYPGPGGTALSEADIHLRLAAWYSSEGHVLSARTAYADAHAAAEGDPETRMHVTLQMTWAAIKAGDYDAASNLVEEARTVISPGTPLWPSLLRLDAWRWLALEQPVRACDVARRALTDARTKVDEARAHDVLTRVHTELLELADSASHWEQAMRMFAESAEPNAVESCIIDRIGMKALVLGDLNEAAGLIAEAERLPGMRDAEVSARVQLHKLIVQVRTGDPMAADTARWLVAPHAPEWPTHLRVRVLTAALSLGVVPPDDDTLQLLWDLLDEVRPACARLDLVESFSLCSGTLTPSPYLRARFLGLFPPVNPGSRAFAAKALKKAEVDRVFGSSDTAIDLLKAALPQLRERSHPWGQIRAIEALRRLGVTDEATLFGGTVEAPSGFADAVLLVERARARIDGGEAAGDILEQAGPVIVHEATPSRWHARLAETKAAEALRAWNTAVYERESLAAVEAYTHLGDRGAALRARPPADASRGGEASPGIEPVAPPHVAREQPAARLTIARLNLAAAWSEASGPVPLEAVAERLVTGGAAAAEWLRDTLMSPDDRAFFELPAAEARFEVPLGLASALPLEWMLPDRFAYRSKPTHGPFSSDATRWMQSALSRLGRHSPADGIFGPSTAQALREFLHAQGLHAGASSSDVLERLREALGPPSEAGRVLLVQPFATGYDASEANIESVAGVSVESLYEQVAMSSPLDVNSVREPDLAGLMHEIRSFQPTVLHIVCAVKAHRGVVFLDFARSYRGSGDVFTPQALHRVLSSSAPGTAPTVVLDVARPSSTWEAVTALLCRNQFAADLFALDRVPAVIATGLAHPYEAAQLTRVIAMVVGAGRSLRELLEEIRSSRRRGGHHELDALITYGGAALFATEPELPCHRF